MGCAASKADAASERPTDLATSSPDQPAEEPLAGPLSRSEIDGRIVKSGPEEFELAKTDGGYKLRYACVSQRGYYPEDLYKANQDSFVVIPDFNGSTGDIVLGVFDGHGAEGDLCSRFVRKHIGDELRAAMQKGDRTPGEALEAAYVKLNSKLHAEESCDAEMSGTTAVVAYFCGGELHVANAGDSRIVLGERRGARVVAVPLSSDHTPYRKDERERCKAAGACVRSSRMLDGKRTQWSPAWEATLGTPEQEDDTGDPPRLYAKDLRGPGCAFTRSIGDAAGEAIGVYAVPELVSKHLREPDQFVVLASDVRATAVTPRRRISCHARCAVCAPLRHTPLSTHPDYACAWAGGVGVSLVAGGGG